MDNTTTATIGDKLNFTACFLDTATNVLVDPSTVSLGLYDPTNTLVTTLTPTRQSTGVWSVVYSTSSLTLVGDYSAAWTATGNGADSAKLETFRMCPIVPTDT